MTKNIIKQAGRAFKSADRSISKFGNKLGRDIVNTSNVIDNGIEDAANDTVKFVNKSISAISILADKLINGPNTFSPQAKQVINRYGDIPIMSMVIIRNPIAGAIQGILDTFGGDIQPDKLFHLAVVITLHGGRRIVMQKNEVIDIHLGHLQVNPDGSKIDVVMNGQTMNQMLTNTKQRMGANMFTYSVTNNCQMWIKNLLEANGLATPANITFVVQSVDNLFKNKTGLRKFANSLTDIGGRANMLFSGGNIKYKKLPKSSIICFDCK